MPIADWHPEDKLDRLTERQIGNRNLEIGNGLT
jgi:hypothetical protein